jgi:hypothetical protein
VKCGDVSNHIISCIKSNTADKLGLAWRRLGDDKLAPLLELVVANHSLKYIYLDRNDLTLKSAHVIHDIINYSYELEHLSLSYNHFGDDGVSLIADAIGGIDEDSFEDEEARRSSVPSKALNICFLKKLWLADVGCTHVGAKRIATALRLNRELMSLHLGQNSQIGTEGARYIAEALQNNDSLKLIDLSNCNLDDEGTASLFEALAHNSSILSIDLSGSVIGPCATEAFEALCRNRTVLNIFLKNCVFTEPKFVRRILKTIMAMAQLQVLDLEGCQQLQKYPKTVKNLLFKHRSLSSTTRNALRRLSQAFAAQNESEGSSDSKESSDIVPQSFNEQDFWYERDSHIQVDEEDCIRQDEDHELPPLEHYYPFQRRFRRARSHLSHGRIGFKSRMLGSQVSHYDSFNLGRSNSDHGEYSRDPLEEMYGSYGYMHYNDVDFKEDDIYGLD